MLQATAAAAEHDAYAAKVAEERMLPTHHHDRKEKIPPETLLLPSYN